jgi:hypothetical protein
MLQYQVYLRGELGKIRHVGAAENFLAALSKDLRTLLGLPGTAEELSRYFADQASVTRFVDGLVEDQARQLVEACDIRWRRNGVYIRLTKTTHWSIYSVNVADVDVQQAEPHLKHIFFRHNFNLVGISKDTELLAQKPYSERHPGEKVEYSVLLAARVNGRYRVFDGIHRAIQLARNGASSLDVCASN